MGIDFREHDARERGLPDPRGAALEFEPDPVLARRIQDALDKRREDAAFDAVERRMRAFRADGQGGAE